MIEDDPAERMVDAIVDVVAGLPIPHGFSKDPRDGGGGRSDQKPARLGQNLDICRKQAVNLSIDFAGQSAERLDVFVVRGREPAADIEDLDLMPARFRLSHDRAGYIE